MSDSRIAWLLAAALAGCGAPTAPSPADQLDAARTRWQAQGLESYRFELTRSCYCLFGGRVVAITVEQGSITRAEYAGSGATVERELIGYLPTVPDLFDLIQDGLSRPADLLLASYDPIGGYPTRIQIDYATDAVDDEITIVVKSLMALREVVR